MWLALSPLLAALLFRIVCLYVQIVDEAHRLKNANSQLYSTLIQMFHWDHSLLLTGVYGWWWRT